MTGELWERIKEIFDAALGLEAEERRTFVERACSGDETLRNEVFRLLTAHEGAGSFLQEPIFAAGDVLAPGNLLANRYRIIELLGRGGMGEVYKVHDELVNELVALKTLRADFCDDPGVLQRFKKEMQLARKVTHRNVCRVFDVGIDQRHGGEPVHFFTMELVEGETLSARIRREGRMAPADAIPLVIQMAAGLAAAHEAGIVHRDFKCNNVILAGDRPVITDFGLARQEITATDPINASTITAISRVVGTVGYMSPEQLTGGPITPASDIYSFGIVLFEMVTGRLPFTGNHIIDSAVKRATGQVPTVRSLVPDIDQRWELAIDRCLRPNPDERCRSATEIAAIFQNDRRSPVSVASIKNLPLRRRTELVLASFAASLVALFFFLSHFSFRGLDEGSKIMMAPTINASGEQRFDGVTTVLRASLHQSARFRLWDNNRLNSVLRSMRRTPQDELTARDWREVAFRDDVHFLVFSTLSKIGGGYALAVRCEQIGASPDPPMRYWDHTITASGPTGLFDAIHEAASWMRRTAGETESELSAHNRLPQDITSSSWEALELFEEAGRLQQQQPTPAISLLRRATELDPQFAMALMRLGDILNAQQEGEEGVAYWREAIKQGRAQHLSDHERLTIESRYFLEIGDEAGAEPLLREWTGKFPNDPLAMELLSASLIGLGRYPEAITIARQARQRFGPSLFGTGRIVLGLAMSHHLDQAETELKILKELPAPTWELRFRGALKASREDYESAEAAFQELASMVTGEEAARTTSLLAALAADRGDFDRAANLLQDGVTHDRQAGEPGLAAQKASALAFIESIRGNRESSRAWALEAVSMDTSRRTVMQAVSTLARQGYLKDARQVSVRMPHGEGPRYEAALLRVQGEILAAEGQYDKAIEVMEHAARRSSALLPKEFLARVLALGGQHERARIIYSDIVNTPWLVWAAPESEWPGLRLLAKRYLASQKGE
jgi:serine/threonine protein kinase/tetratricopeptide (TPR) repeat protein